jgi:tetratricopeptide (TPR) repeat protein
MASGTRAVIDGDPEGALKHYDEAANWFYEANDIRLVGKAYEASGDILADTGDGSAAIDKYGYALGAFQTIGDNLDEIRPYERSCELIEKKGEVPDAVRCFLNSAELARRYGNTEVANKALNRLAVLNDDAGQPEIAAAFRASTIGGDSRR